MGRRGTGAWNEEEEEEEGQVSRWVGLKVQVCMLTPRWVYLNPQMGGWVSPTQFPVTKYTF